MQLYSTLSDVHEMVTHCRQQLRRNVLPEKERRMFRLLVDDIANRDKGAWEADKKFGFWDYRRIGLRREAFTLHESIIKLYFHIKCASDTVEAQRTLKTEFLADDWINVQYIANGASKQSP